MSLAYIPCAFTLPCLFSLKLLVSGAGSASALARPGRQRGGAGWLAMPTAIRRVPPDSPKAETPLHTNSHCNPHPHAAEQQADRYGIYAVQLGGACLGHHVAPGLLGKRISAVCQVEQRSARRQLGLQPAAAALAAVDWPCLAGPVLRMPHLPPSRLAAPSCQILLLDSRPDNSFMYCYS